MTQLTSEQHLQLRLAEAAALASGVIFGVGLAIAQMVDPRKVINFLDFAGTWDPSLLFVLGGAVVVAAIGFHVVLGRSRPVLAESFHLSKAKGVDTGLLAGAALFGIGWGISGYCPGPAIASLGFGNPEAWWFVPAMFLGAGVHQWQRRFAAKAAPSTA